MDPAVIKFDCALIQGIDRANERRQRLVAAMVKMVRELGITPMAEYVETEAEHETLKQIGFELSQGFYYGHPSSIENIVDEVNVEEIDSDSLIQASLRPIDIAKSFAAPATEESNLEVSASEEDAPEEAVEDELWRQENVKDADWLLEQDDEQLTLQLMFAATEQEAHEFVGDREESGDYAIYRKWSSNREWYVVVFGIFTERDDATAEAANFEDTGHSSWVRRLTAVKEEIHSVDELE